jgi:hypothetical protein
MAALLNTKSFFPSRYIREVERIRGLEGTRPYNQDPVGTARPFTNNYGLDFDTKQSKDS